MVDIRPPRKVLMSPELMEQWASRDKDGYLLTWDWGEPDVDGFYTPTITRHDDDQMKADKSDRLTL